VGVHALVRISMSSLSSDLRLSFLEVGMCFVVLCFHFLMVALVPKAKRCQSANRDLRFAPSGSSKATTREEEESTE